MELYISDLDGTLLNSKQELSKKTIEIINNLIETKGLNFTVATARSLTSAWQIIKPLILKYPILFHNGVFIYDPVLKKNIKENFIENFDCRKLIQIIEKNNLQPIVFTTDLKYGDKVYYKGIYNLGEKDYIQRRLDQNDDRFTQIDNYNDILYQKIITINIINNRANIEEIHYLLKSNYNLYYHLTQDIYSNYYWLEISNINANKKDGVKFIKSYLNVSRLISFGDNLNDLPMFEESDEKYTVSNAKDELKNYSTKIIESNDNNGVAEFLKNKFLIN